jgi:hypothetical protein
MVVLKMPSSSSELSVCLQEGAPGPPQLLTVCRGAWARVTIDHFRRLALQACQGHRVSTNVLAEPNQVLGLGAHEPLAAVRRALERTGSVCRGARGTRHH